MSFSPANVLNPEGSKVPRVKILIMIVTEKKSPLVVFLHLFQINCFLFFDCRLSIVCLSSVYHLCRLSIVCLSIVFMSVYCLSIYHLSVHHLSVCLSSICLPLVCLSSVYHLHLCLS